MPRCCRTHPSQAHHVKEGQVVLLNAQVCYLLPLLPGRVDARGVVCAACMQQSGLATSTGVPVSTCKGGAQKHLRAARTCMADFSMIASSRKRVRSMLCVHGVSIGSPDLNPGQNDVTRHGWRMGKRWANHAESRQSPREHPGGLPSSPQNPGPPSWAQSSGTTSTPRQHPQRCSVQQNMAQTLAWPNLTALWRGSVQPRTPACACLAEQTSQACIEQPRYPCSSPQACPALGYHAAVHPT